MSKLFIYLVSTFQIDVEFVYYASHFAMLIAVVLAALLA